MKLAIKNLSGVLDEPISLFVAMASFEDRCRAIGQGLIGLYAQALLFRNPQAGEFAARNLQMMMEIAGDKASSAVLDLDDPTATARSLLTVVEQAAKGPDGSIFVDITTFTHEQLLILFRVLEEAKPDRNIVFGYTGANEYSINTAPADVWLSRGVSQVRSVLGFPGNLLPSKRLHLVVLVGFEHERAKAVIEAFEPNALSLGIGEQGQSVSEQHFQTNRRFFEDVQKFVERRTSLSSTVNTFTFSCVDPLATKRVLLNEIARLPDYNTVVCPMNTKLSTLGVALAARELQRVQLCYARAIEYNEEGYSTASDEVTIFQMRFS